MRTILLLILSFFICSVGLAQLSVLADVQKNRTIGKFYKNAEKYDSAYVIVGKYIANEKYTNPTDDILYCLCCIKTGDTANFIKYLSKAIAAGTERDQVHSWLKKLTGNDLALLDNFLDANYENLRKAGYAKMDTALINEVNLILEMDQLVRTGWKNDSNMKYKMFIGRQIDSINYERVVKLLAAGKYPGFHNCGMYGELFVILMHITDHSEAQFQYIFKKIKQEELEGNISPDEIATIADRHYTGSLTDPHSYYGHWQGRRAELYDCKHVDKFRAEIGLEDLKTEYERGHLALPGCYIK